MAAVKLVVAAAVGYVLMRAAWIFLGWPGVVGLVVLVAAFAAWRRRQWPVAAGVALGATVSALALSL